MGNKKTNNIKIYLLQFIVSGILFFGVSVPFRNLFAVADVTEVRPASVFPIVCGLLFGMPGALGAAVGNFLGDIYSGYSMIFCVAGFLAQFLYGFLPYKLWYAPPFGHKRAPVVVSLSAAGLVGKYMAIVFVDSILMTCYLSLLMEYFGIGSEYTVATLMMLLNNIVFGIVLGIPFVIAADAVHVPKNLPGCMKSNKWRMYLSDVALVVSVLVLVVFFALHGSVDVKPVAWIVYLLAYIYVSKPTDVVDESWGKNDRFTLNEKMVLMFMLLSLLSALFVGVGVYAECTRQGNMARVDLWNRVYLYVAFDIVIFNGMALTLLLYIQKNITKPVERMSEAAVDYLKEEGESAGDEQAGKVFANYEYLNSEVGELATSLLQMVRNTEVYIDNLVTLTAEKERIGAELNVATQIQADMLPGIFPAFPDRTEFDIYASMSPAKEVGGDFYDFFLTDEDHLVMVIADVSGKGVPAALFMVIAKTLIKNQALAGNSPKEILETVNNQLCENNEAEMFVTVWLGIMEISTGRMIAANAGHEYPSVRKADGKFTLLKDKHGLVLAGMENLRYREYEFEIEPGGCLYVYTDGVAEATDNDNVLFGTDRMLDALNQDVAASPKQLLENVQEAINLFVGDAPQFDDITMLAVKRNG